MPKINIDSIMSKVRVFSKADEGKKRMANYIWECRTQGRIQTYGGGTVITLDVMTRAAENMIHILKETAASHKLPTSVLNHFNSLTYSQPEITGKSGDMYKVDIFFADDLSRLSLLIVGGERDGQRTGEGIDNIVSLFDTGYSANNNAWGLWSGHEDAGIIMSLEHRDGMYFMREAVDSFNREFGDLYNVCAQIIADPRFYAR